MADEIEALANDLIDGAPGSYEEHLAKLKKAASALTSLKAERDATIREMTEHARARGEAEGRLKASQWPGVVEGWRERAEAAERERDEARAEVERLRKRDAAPEVRCHHEAYQGQCAHCGVLIRNGKPVYAFAAALHPEGDDDGQS